MKANEEKEKQRLLLCKTCPTQKENAHECINSWLDRQENTMKNSKREREKREKGKGQVVQTTITLNSNK